MEIAIASLTGVWGLANGLTIRGKRMANCITERYHLMFSCLVMVGCFILMGCHWANHSDLVPVVTMLIGHYIGRQSVNGVTADAG